jgi:hypothetical protein
MFLITLLAELTYKRAPFLLLGIPYGTIAYTFLWKITQTTTNNKERD